MKDFNSNFQNMDREKQSSEGKTYGDIRVDNIPQDGKQQRKDYVDEEYVDFEELNEER